MQSRKAQASFELALIMGFSLTLTVLGVGYYILYSNQATDALNQDQLDRIFNDIIEQSSRVHFAGVGNRVTIQASFPSGIERIALENMTNAGGAEIHFINVTYISSGDRDGTLTSLQYFPTETFIFFSCNTDLTNNGSCVQDGNSLEFLPEHTTRGPKTIRVESRRNYVEINFIN